MYKWLDLFQKPRRTFTCGDQIWFENCPIGVNKIGAMMKEISTDAELSQVYSNHCVRSTTESQCWKPPGFLFTESCKPQATEMNQV